MEATGEVRRRWRRMGGAGRQSWAAVCGMALVRPGYAATRRGSGLREAKEARTATPVTRIEEGKREEGGARGDGGGGEGEEAVGAGGAGGDDGGGVRAGGEGGCRIRSGALLKNASFVE